MQDEWSLVIITIIVISTTREANLPCGLLTALQVLETYDAFGSPFTDEKTESQTS